MPRKTPSKKSPKKRSTKGSTDTDEPSTSLGTVFRETGGLAAIVAAAAATIAANPPVSRNTVPRLVEGSSVSVLPLVLRFFGLFLLGVLRGIVAPPSKHRCRCASRVAPLAVQLKSGVLRLYETMTMRRDRCAPLASAKGLWIANLCYGYLCLAPLQEGYGFAAMGTLRYLLLPAKAQWARSGCTCRKIGARVCNTLGTLVSYKER